jgi:hypothetical protein
MMISLHQATILYSLWKKMSNHNLGIALLFLLLLESTAHLLHSQTPLLV